MSLRGSFLIICMVLMTLIVILSFAALHAMTEEIDVSTTNSRYLLAQGAALAGFDHAVEQILIDYDAPTATLPKVGGGSTTVPNVTFLDGAWRAPFTAIYRPNSLSSASDNNDPTLNDADVRAEDYVLRPWAWWWFDVNGNWGYSEYDGKGRYYEPGYYNTTPAAVGAGVPVAATSFVNLGAAVPERSQGMFYDEQFRRVPPSGNPATDRENARYRLRYTVGVEDLQGHLLMNPIPDMQLVSGPGQVVDYRTPWTNYPWMTAADNALGVVSGAMGGTFAAQLEHVFMGRGYHTNVDFDHTASTGVSGWPKTFPLMYRSHPEPGHPTPGDGGWGTFTDGYNSAGLSNNLYHTANGVIKGLMGGGENTPPGAYGNDGWGAWPYPDGTINHCMIGPMFDFQEIAYAAHGEEGYLGPEGGGNSSTRPWDNFVTTPFGRVQLQASYTPGHGGYWQGHCTTPFHINVLTAPAPLVNEMLLGYLPPVDKIIQYTNVNWYSYVGPNPNGGTIYNLVASMPISGTNPANEGSCYGRDLLVSTTAPPCFAQWPPPTRADGNPPGATNPPSATGIGQIVSPDYHAVDTRMSLFPASSPPWPYAGGTAAWPSPGPFMEGDSATKGQGSDNLGLHLDQTSLFNAYDLNTWANFASLPGGNPYAYYSQFSSSNVFPNPTALAASATWATVAAPPVGWGMSSGDYMVKTAPPIAELHVNSYYLNMVCAMGTAIAVLRAEYTQYNHPGWLSHTQFFGKGNSKAPLTDPNPANFTTLHDLDRLFLEEMGESIAAPGSGPPSALFTPTGLKAYQFHNIYTNPCITSDYISNNNIYSLVHNDLIANTDDSVTSLQRGHVMSLLLNDFRMSFLGSSPDYSDGIDPATGSPNPALQFMPLDFVGDGKTYCSCFGTHVDKDGLPCADDGSATPPNYFSIDGNFFMGKSHFYRIWTRGEIWDNFLARKLDSAILESAIAVDPEGNNPLNTQLLCQRWVFDRYNANISHVQR